MNNLKYWQNTKARKQNDNTERRKMWKEAVKTLRTCFRKYQNLQSHTCEFFDRAPRAGTNNENDKNRSSQRSKVAKARMWILRSRTQSWYWYRQYCRASPDLANDNANDNDNDNDNDNKNYDDINNENENDNDNDNDNDKDNANENANDKDNDNDDDNDNETRQRQPKW